MNRQPQSSTLPSDIIPVPQQQSYFRHQNTSYANQHPPVSSVRSSDRPVRGASPSFYKLIRTLRKTHPVGERPARRETRIDHETGETLSEDGSPCLSRFGTSERKRKGVSFTPDTLVLDAITKGSAFELESLLKNNDIDLSQLIPNGDTLLHRAAFEGNVDVIKVIIRYGGNPNQKNSDGWPPIHYAFQQAHLPAVIYLIECGTNMTDYTKRRVEEFKAVKEICSQVYKGEEVYV